MSKNKKTEYILLDTNMYHGFFMDDNFEKKILPLLEKIALNGYTFLIPQQIIDEINRNRYSVWSKTKNSSSIEELEKIKSSLDNDKLKELSNLPKFRKQIELKIETLKKEDIKFFKKITSSRGTNIIESLIKISKIIEDNKEIFDLTQLRKIKNNPPTEKGGKENEKSCDRYIWESILYFFIKNEIKKPKLFFFSRNDTDWCIKPDNSKESFFNPFLIDEFKDKTKGQIVWFNDLKNLPQISDKDKKDVQKIEDEIKENDILNRIQTKIANKLRESNSWGNTDNLIDIITPYIKKFNQKTISEILKASIENQDYSFGPYNQVLDASKSKQLFVQLYMRSKEIDFPLSEWRTFYLLLDENQQKRFYDLRKDMEKNGVSFELTELQFIHPDDVPF
jgi:hypothetical protein